MLGYALKLVHLEGCADGQHTGLAASTTAIIREE